MHHSDSTRLPIDSALSVGIDVGGTKTEILDNASGTVHRYITHDYVDMYAILDDYFSKLGTRPARLALAIAGPRDDTTGSVTITSRIDSLWPTFEPRQAERRYPGTHFETMNDMIGAVHGILGADPRTLSVVKSGTGTATGGKLVVTISTGIGMAGAVWDNQTARYIPIPSEGGHSGLQPLNEQESAYVRFLQSKHLRASLNNGLSGSAGIDNLTNYILEGRSANQLKATVAQARQANKPTGAVLLDFAQTTHSSDQMVAQMILKQMGAMLGAALRDQALSFKATGGVYLMGSVAAALADYWITNTPFIERFVHAGATHDSWVKNIPIMLVSDSHIVVKGALEVAKKFDAFEHQL